jgi:glycosyltransferase involved in cell wall biosynthesis
VRIGIVVPAFNVAPYIGDTIRSVLAQTYRNWTMVVVDDGSTDDTVAVVQGFRDCRVRLITQPNAGVSAARNRGAMALDCDAVLFLDGDDWLAPFALDALGRTLAASPDAAAAVGAYERGGQVFPPASGDLLERLLVRNLFVNGGHVLIRRDAVQPFRDGLRYGEDWEFWVRLALRGPFAAAAEPCPVLFVRERASGAYLRMATDPESFRPCLDAIHANPDLAARLSPDRRTLLRRRAGAEVFWVIGRELIRHGRTRHGIAWLCRSLAAAPTLRRAAVLASVAVLPPGWRGPLRPYAGRHARPGSIPCPRITASTAGSVRKACSAAAASGDSARLSTALENTVTH